MPAGFIYSSKFAWLAGIVLYIGLWAYCAIRAYWCSHHYEGVMDIRKVEKYSALASMSRRYAWFAVAIIMVFVQILMPEVSVVRPFTPECEGKHLCGSLNYKDIWYSTNSDNPVLGHGYVTFYYDGVFCSPFCTYLYNDTPDTLMLYKTRFLNLRYLDVEDRILLPPSRRISFNHHISNFFRRPYQATTMIRTFDKKVKESTEWTIERKDDAEASIEYIKDEIRYGFSGRVPRNVNGIILENVKKSLPQGAILAVDSILNKSETTHDSE